MKKLTSMLLAILVVCSFSVSALAISPVPAVILDHSYTPIHDRPVVDLFNADGTLNTAVAIAGPTTEIFDHSYTPIHDNPVIPLFDEQGNPTFVEGIEGRGIIVDCPDCGKSLKPVAKSIYETAGCGHTVYFKGWVCRDWRGCGYQRIDEWIYSCTCWQ